MPPSRKAKSAGNTWYAQHQYGEATIMSSKCYSIGFNILDVSLLHNSLNAPFTYYDECNVKKTVHFRCYMIGNKAKYYLVVNNRELTYNLIAHSPLNCSSDPWLVLYACQEGRPAAIVFTKEKKRCEKTIAEAVKAAQKVVKLPSNSTDLQCNTTDL
ncbi:unnamed protein product [Acanthoscelides obtectus]|uniref:Uncharacterized protein n=1 Tax=Acanthoscelides obtectus TaxID=200917 RepID=A0A9P0M082_ACAOB|nr:unnamed protein product [Acanthoscelides obtectus]CAK1660994.1 hypothetical protein AOBTE_LOCUS22380 [Acanthoscelides obtectus]